MNTAQINQELLPKPPLDLPTPELDLPTSEKELPAHVTAPHHHDDAHHIPKQEVRTLLSWTAPGRPFRKRSKQYYLSAMLITMLVEIILFLFAEYMLMLVVLSLLFVALALAIVPPHDFHYRISTEGITVEDHSFLWLELYDFYFKKRHGLDVLHVSTHALIPGEITLSLGDLHKEQMKQVLLPYLPFREVVKPTFMEKSGNFLAKNFPLEKTSSQN